MRMVPWFVAFVILCGGSGAQAQETWQHGVGSRGRAAQGSTRLAAEQIVRAAGVDCTVVTASVLGRDEHGVIQYEASCRDGPGYLLLGPPENKALNCLALEAQSRRRPTTTCRRAANRDALPLVSRLAREAGLDCRVDEAEMVGLTPAGRPLYEAGCQDASGAWLEDGADGRVVTDCLVVIAQGGACRFTSAAETTTGVRDRLGDRLPIDCALIEARYMGGGEGALFVEGLCADGSGFVVRFDAAWRPAEIIPCPQAEHIGGGCGLGRSAP